MGKQSDYEIMRTLETHLKGVLWKMKLNFVLSWAFKCTLETYMTGLSQMLFQYHPIHVDPSTQ